MHYFDILTFKITASGILIIKIMLVDTILNSIFVSLWNNFLFFWYYIQGNRIFISQLFYMKSCHCNTIYPFS